MYAQSSLISPSFQSSSPHVHDFSHSHYSNASLVISIFSQLSILLSLHFCKVLELFLNQSAKFFQENTNPLLVSMKTYKEWWVKTCFQLKLQNSCSWLLKLIFFFLCKYRLVLLRVVLYQIMILDMKVIFSRHQNQ